MNKTKMFSLMLTGMLVLAACSPRYALTGVSHQRIIVDQRFEDNPDAAATAFMTPYKHKVDSVMGPVIGMLEHDMAADRPESDLSNLLSDILIWAAKNYGEQPDLAIYNLGGIRASLTKGKVTYGDVVDVAPFENKICFITLNGVQLMKLFGQIAAKGGEGVSHGIELVINADGALISARLHGREIDPSASYRIATIDYLAQGNDGLSVFKDGTNLVSPQEQSNNSRFIIMDYFKEQAAQGKSVSAKVEGRIKVVK